MTPTVEAKSQERAAPADLTEAVHAVLATSDEPLTPAKIRAALPPSFRAASAEELTDCLNRQVAAQALVQYPRYRSPHERYWDRPMPVHVATLLRQLLSEEPVPLFEIRRKLPAYAASLAEEVLREQLGQGKLHRHPPVGKRGSERYGASPPDAKEYLRPELAVLFRKLEETGFAREQLRIGALELLHDEQWADPPAAEAEKETPAGKTWA